MSLLGLLYFRAIHTLIFHIRFYESDSKSYHGGKKKILLIKSLLCYFLLLWLGEVFSSGYLKIGEGKSTLVKIEFLYLLIRAEIKVFQPRALGSLENTILQSKPTFLVVDAKIKLCKIFPSHSETSS